MLLYLGYAIDRRDATLKYTPKCYEYSNTNARTQVRLNTTIAVMVTTPCVLTVNVKMRFERILASTTAVFALKITTFRTSQRIPHVTRLVQITVVQSVSIEKIVVVQISVNRLEHAYHARIFP